MDTDADTAMPTFETDRARVVDSGGPQTPFLTPARKAPAQTGPPKDDWILSI